MTAWVGQELVARVGRQPHAADRLTMALVAVLTALINVNGAVAALVPVAVVMAVRHGRSPSQLLLPLAFGAHAGSLLALTGTPVNVIVSDAAADAGVGSFGFFEFALVGVPLRARRDRDRRAASASACCRSATRARSPPDFSDHARTLIDAVRARPRRGRADDAPLRRRRGRDPAALGARRRPRLPGHDHRRAATS